MNLGAQLGPVSITKLSPNWACQMGPIHCPKFLLPGSPSYFLSFKRGPGSPEAFEVLHCWFINWFLVNRPTAMGGDVGGRGDAPQIWGGDGPCIRPPNIWRG